MGLKIKTNDGIIEFPSINETALSDYKYLKICDPAYSSERAALCLPTQANYVNYSSFADGTVREYADTTSPALTIYANGKKYYATKDTYTSAESVVMYVYEDVAFDRLGIVSDVIAKDFFWEKEGETLIVRDLPSLAGYTVTGWYEDTSGYISNMSSGKIVSSSDIAYKPGDVISGPDHKELLLIAKKTQTSWNDPAIATATVTNISYGSWSSWSNYYSSSWEDPSKGEYHTRWNVCRKRTRTWTATLTVIVKSANNVSSDLTAYLSKIFYNCSNIYSTVNYTEEIASSSSTTKTFALSGNGNDVSNVSVAVYNKDGALTDSKNISVNIDAYQNEVLYEQ